MSETLDFCEAAAFKEMDARWNDLLNSFRDKALVVSSLKHYTGLDKQTDIGMALADAVLETDPTLSEEQRNRLTPIVGVCVTDFALRLYDEVIRDAETPVLEGQNQCK